MNEANSCKIWLGGPHCVSYFFALNYDFGTATQVNAPD